VNWIGTFNFACLESVRFNEKVSFFNKELHGLHFVLGLVVDGSRSIEQDSERKNIVWCNGEDDDDNGTSCNENGRKIFCTGCCLKEWSILHESSLLLPGHRTYFSRQTVNKVKNF